MNQEEEVPSTEIASIQMVVNMIDAAFQRHPILLYMAVNFWKRRRKMILTESIKEKMIKY
jgi:hypothetical protein